MREMPLIPESLRALHAKALAGDAWSQTQMGYHYHVGDSVPQDHLHALPWYELAAAQKQAQAIYNIGLLYGSSEVLGVDLKKAVAHFRQAHELGYSAASRELGRRYQNGQGVEIDYTEAIRLYTIASDKNDATAKVWLGYMKENGLGQKPDAAGAFDFYVEAALLDNPWGMANAALCYYYATGVSKNYSEAANWARLASDKGNASAQRLLGVMHQQGNGLIKDYEEAFRYYKLSADNDYALAQFDVGVMYEKGMGVEQSFSSAFNYYLLSCSQGNVSATRALAGLMDNGNGTEMDKFKATKFYIKVGLSGDHEVQRALGCRFETPGYVLSGVDLIESYAWYNVSAASGNEGAIKGRTDVEAKLKPAEIALAHKRSRELLKEIEANKAKK